MPFETFLSDRLKVKVTWGQIKVKCSYIELFRAVTCTFMHGCQNNFAQLLTSRRKSAI